MKLTFKVDHSLEEIHTLIKEEAEKQGFSIEESSYYNDHPNVLNGGAEYGIDDEDDVPVALLIVSPTCIFLKDEQFGAMYEFTTTGQGVVCTYEHCHIESFMTHSFVPALNFTLTGDESVECERYGNIALREYVLKVQVELAITSAYGYKRDSLIEAYKSNFTGWDNVSKGGMLHECFAHLCHDTPPSCEYTLAKMCYSPHNTALDIIAVNGVNLWHFNQDRVRSDPQTFRID